MSIFFFTKGNRNTASSRVRVYRVHDKLQNQQYKVGSEVYHVQALPWWEISRRRFNQIKSNFLTLLKTESDDIIYLQRTIHQWDFIFLVLFFHFLFQKKIIFDFDDAIFIKSPLKTKILVKISSKIICI
jgi:hypothetical protein